MAYSVFLVSLDSIPVDPPYELWFSAWSDDKSQLKWTKSRPQSQDLDAPWVIGAHVSNSFTPPPVPAGTTELARGIKDVPPPPFLQAKDIRTDGFNSAFVKALGLSKSFSAP
jgi:hypothetical protein